MKGLEFYFPLILTFQSWLPGLEIPILRILRRLRFSTLKIFPGWLDLLWITNSSSKKLNQEEKLGILVNFIYVKLTPGSCFRLQSMIYIDVWWMEKYQDGRVKLFGTNLYGHWRLLERSLIQIILQKYSRKGRS